MNKLIGLTVVLLLVIFAFIYFNTQKDNVFSFATAASVSHPQKLHKGDVATEIIPVSIKNNKLVSPTDGISVGKDEMVVLQITSDTDDSLSLLGYDKQVFLKKGKMVILSFLSSAVGDFSYVLNSTQKTIGSIHITQ